MNAVRAPCAGPLRVSSIRPQVISLLRASSAALCGNFTSRTGTSKGGSRGVLAPPSSHSAVEVQTQTSYPGLQGFEAQVQDRKFHCTQCGKCCTGSGEVWMTDEEAAVISAHSGQLLDQFSAERTKTLGKHVGFRILKNKPEPELPCVFLVDNKCSIHTVRPGQCSTYPWWPELMDKKRWEWEKESVCEGFDHAEATELDVTNAALQLQDQTAQSVQIWLSKEKEQYI